MNSVHSTNANSGFEAALWEKAGITAAAVAYMAYFKHTLPHGDAMRIVRQIQASDLIWNPNHLLLDPAGYGMYRLTDALGTGLTILGSFQLLSAIATLVSLLLFHAVLVRAGVPQPCVRLVSVAGLFATTCFLALAGGQYFFMIQMPLMIGALYLYVDLLDSNEPRRVQRNAAWMGVLLAVATTIMFSNLLLVITAGIALAFTQTSWSAWQWRNSLAFWVAAAVIGFPVFIGGYLLGDSSAGFMSWLLSYQGESQSNLNNVYGMRWNLSSIVEGAALVGYNAGLGNMVEPAGLATLIAKMAQSQPLEFIPQWTRMALGLIALPLAFVFHLIIAIYALRRFLVEPAVRFFCSWLVAFLVFNFLWKVGDEIFWVQITPITWLVFLMAQGLTPRLVRQPETGAARRPITTLRTAALTAFVALLLVVNTYNTVLPIAASSYERNQAEHAAILRDGDLEVVPGWDQNKWTVVPDGGPAVRQLMLMNMATAGPGTPNSLEQLPYIVARHLNEGGRVIVGRLYDKDKDQLPWYGMADIGWPRAKVLELLSDYCARPLTTIDGIAFRELHACDETTPEH